MFDVAKNTMALPELTDRLFRLLKINRPDIPATTIDLDRALTPEERVLIEWLLLHGTPDAKDFLPQMETVRVHGRCSCGCPSIDLAVPLTTPAVTSETRLLADFVGTVGKVLVGILVHQSCGRLGELEVYAFGETPVPFSLPEPSSLRRFEDAASTLEEGSNRRE